MTTKTSKENLAWAKKAYAKKVDDSFAYTRRVNEMVSGLLYDTYLKYLVSLSSKPDSSVEKKYYA